MFQLNLTIPNKNLVFKPLTLAVTGIILTACSSTPNTPTTTRNVTPTIKSSPIPTTIKHTQTTTRVQESIALLDDDSLDELSNLLEATDMTMVENNALLVQRYGDVWDRMRVNFKMETLYDPRIEAQKSWFISRQDYLNRLTARASRYLYHTVREAERRSIPTELALLPVIESSYDPSATSNAAAAGLWQFIPSTGRIYGLTQTSTFDGRRDVIESTRAAYDFLTSLYNQFGSWELALAAYNAGPGRVQSAINANQARGLPTDYWSLKLPTETMNYVPRFMAVAQIVKDPASYGVYLPAIANRQHFRSVPTNVGVSLTQISGLIGVSYDELKALNPALKSGLVDANGPNRVLIPNDVNQNFDKQISQLGTNSWLAKTNNSTNSIQQAFPIVTNNSSNKVNKTPLPKSSDELANIATQMVQNQTTTYVPPINTNNNNRTFKEPPITIAEQRQVTAEMQSTNTLPTTSATITTNNTIIQEPPLSPAERASIAQQIEKEAPNVNKAINPIDGNISLTAVQTQQVILETKGESKRISYEETANTKTNNKPTNKPTGKRSTYQVQQGDTLANIAYRMGVNWRDIAEWNQIDPNKSLYVGTTLYLYDAKPIAIETVEEKRPDIYTVQSGDTLSGIAYRYGLSVSELARYNNVSTEYQVKLREKLWLVPNKVSSNNNKITTSNNSKPDNTPKKPRYQGTTSKYTVESGDNLITIANKLSVSVNDIADLNGFDNQYKVKRGEVLIVPASQAKVTRVLNNKSVTYTVKSGDSLNSIAREFNISLADLAQANNLKTNAGLITNQKLTIPANNTVTSKINNSNNKANNTDDNKPQTTTKYKGATESYQVKSGDSLNGLSARYGISANELASMNNLKANSSLFKGQTIKVPKLTTSYKVKSGDSLILLAKKYGMSTKELADMNNISPNTELKIGQVLTVPNR